MRINNINIKNFRGFADRSFDLDPKMNVVLGNNATGKTTLLHAVQIALGAYLQSLSLLPKELPFRRNFRSTDRVLKYNIEKDEHFYSKENPYICIESTFKTIGKKNGNPFEEEKKISWYREMVGNTTIHSQKNVGQLIDIVKTLSNIRESEGTDSDVVLPIVLAFGADRIDNNYKLVVKDKKKDSRIAKAYKFALDEKVDFKSALDWYYRFNTTAKNSKEIEGTDVAFEKALETAVGIKNIERDPSNRNLWADITVGENTERLHYEIMSSGFKSMINMVAEIAYRCIMLNRWLGIDAVEKTPGIVMIDEVDLYLHPLWQRHVLEDFQRAFPNIQFIVTTHSPFIVQSVKTENIIKLDGEKGNSDPNIRNMEEVTVVEMNVPSMHTDNYNKMLEKADEFYNLIKQGNSTPEEKARIKKELVELEAKFSENPAYVALLKAEGEIK